LTRWGIADPQDKEMRGMLAALGIIKGKPFNPDDQLRALLDKGAAPKGDFSLYLRAYWPKTEIIDGSWTPPAVQRV
jgi:hypothetical protein